MVAPASSLVRCWQQPLLVVDLLLPRIVALIDAEAGQPFDGMLLHIELAAALEDRLGGSVSSRLCPLYNANLPRRSLS